MRRDEKMTHVIVCDDEPLVVKVTVSMIERVRPDLEVMMTTDPSAVLQTVVEANGAVALVTDYHLGAELTGAMLIELARQSGYAHPRAVIISGLLGRDKVPLVEGIEIRLWSKPFTAEDVRDMMTWLVPLDAAQPRP